MSEVKYQTIEIDGTLFDNGFSIYLMELKENGQKSFYVGMTGDSYYPSARSAFHRLAGHFDRAIMSTQNQLREAIGERESYAGINLKMHHFSIEGYEPMVGASNKKEDENYFKNPPFNGKYAEYKEQQKNIAQLENHLIFMFRECFKGKEPFSLLNKTKGKECTSLSKTQEDIVNEIKAIVERG